MNNTLPNARVLAERIARAKESFHLGEQNAARVAFASGFRPLVIVSNPNIARRPSAVSFSLVR